MPRDSAHLPYERVPRRAPRTILIVEDNLPLRSTLADCLRDCNYDVCEADSVEEALALLGRGLSVDLAISDVLMPGTLNGVDFVCWMERHCPEIPVFLASGAQDLSEIAERFPSVRGCLEKPFGLDELERAVCEVFQETGRTTSPTSWTPGEGLLHQA